MSTSKRIDITANAWSGYELLDSGENMKLERFGEVVVARPETQALWLKKQPELWSKADAFFSWEKKKGAWKIAKDVPEKWQVPWKKMHLNAQLTSFKHTGIFPEQAPNWEWIEARTKALKNPKVLNLFGYTGGASIVAALAGADVTHVDASKQSLTWAHKNADSSGIDDSFEDGSVRYILDDALRFAKREARRGTSYDGIILDPPAFGRGAKGEVWHIEKDLPILMEILQTLLSETAGCFFLLNGYASGYSPRTFLQMTEDIFPKENITYGEISIAQRDDEERVVPADIYVRFARGTDTS